MIAANKEGAEDLAPRNAMAATRIDCDIHPAVGGTRTTLLPYLDDHWKEQVVSRAIDGLDLNSYPPSMPLSGPGRLAAGRRQQARRRSCDGAARRVRSARRQPRDLQRASTARRRCSIPTWRPTSARRSTTGSRPNGCREGPAAAGLDRGADPGAGSRGRGDRAPRRRPPLRVGAGARAGRDACSGGGTTGRSIRPPRNTSCRSRSTPAAPIAARRARSAGRPTATNIISPRRRRSRPRC